MATSEEFTLAFYDRLGAAGLAARTRPEWDEQALAQLRRMLRASERILDLGCGYGRITIPLALDGFEVVGLDASAALLAVARERAIHVGANVQFILANMCSTSLENNSFDVVICLWSAFHELLELSEQKQALSEMRRLLKPGGWALIEGGLGTTATLNELASGQRYGFENRISADFVAGMLNPHFQHDASTFSRLFGQLGIEDFAISVDDWAGRKRQLVRFRKSERTEST